MSGTGPTFGDRIEQRARFSLSPSRRIPSSTINLREDGGVTSRRWCGLSSSFHVSQPSYCPRVVDDAMNEHSYGPRTTSRTFLALAPHGGSFVTLIAWRKVPRIPSQLTIESVINETATNGLARKVTRAKRRDCLARNAFLMPPLARLLQQDAKQAFLHATIQFSFFAVRFVRATIRSCETSFVLLLPAPLCKFDPNAIRDLHFGSVGYRGRMMMMMMMTVPRRVNAIPIVRNLIDDAK